MPDTAKGDGQSSSVEHALAFMRRRILSGEYPPGSRLPLNVLARETGVSLIPVREALRVLETERLIETTRNRGARVVPLSVDDMNDLYAVRTVLETEAVKNAAAIDTAVEEQELLDILSQMRFAVSKNDTDEVIRLHKQYHFAIYRRSNSPWLLYLIDLLWNHSERYQRLSLGLRHDAADEEHRQILDAVVAGRSDLAAEALKHHLATTAKIVVDFFSNAEDKIPIG
jgi:DNA-binding GntR family transcriptional regulator